jgi:helicase MOV-10
VWKSFKGRFVAIVTISMKSLTNSYLLHPKERKAIIISTVRSSRDFVHYDLRHTLGFVANPRRFNGPYIFTLLDGIFKCVSYVVAVTRAKALLIVIGDPTVLSLDPLWRSFLNYVHLHGGWKGPPPTWDTHAPVLENEGYDQRMRETGLADMNDFTSRMELLTLAGIDSGEDGIDVDANVDRPWREVE